MPLKKTRPRDTVAVVGPGNVGTTLAMELRRVGVPVTEIVTRDEAASRRKGVALARQVKAKAATVSNARLDATVVWLCVSDANIAFVAAQLAKLPVRWKGKTVLHASGSMLAAELAPLKKLGAATASFHPMNTFVPGRPNTLMATPFGAEGDPSAIAAGTRLARLVSGVTAIPVVFKIRPQDKPLYHAMGAFSSPLIISALNIGERIGREIGVPRSFMSHILLKTANNFSIFGSSGAFSGPIRRGDVATIRKHLSALKRVPGAENVYRALALNAVEHLPAKNQAELRKLLKKSKK